MHFINIYVIENHCVGSLRFLICSSLKAKILIVSQFSFHLNHPSSLSSLDVARTVIPQIGRVICKPLFWKLAGLHTLEHEENE